MNMLRPAHLVSVGLLLASFVITPLAAAPKLLRPELADLKWELPPVRSAWLEARNVTVPIPEFQAFESMGTPWRNVHQWGAYRSGVCGLMLTVVPRASELRDPVPVIAAAYWGCWTMMAEIFEPRVQVEHYPEGYFGDLASEGMLCVEQREIASEAERATLFALLVQAVELREDETEFAWPDAATGGTTARDIRWEAGLVPEAALEFVGTKSLRVELSLKQGRMLVLAGGKWSVYRLDRPMVAAFEEFLTPVSEMAE